jgi:hypothetical protein
LKAKWHEAYRLARILKASSPTNEDPLARLPVLQWKAWLVVRFKRNAVDGLTISLRARFEAMKIVGEILECSD